MLSKGRNLVVDHRACFKPLKAAGVCAFAGVGLVFFVVAMTGCEGDYSVKKAPPKTTTPPAPPAPPSADQMISEAVQSLRALDIIPPGVPIQFWWSDEDRARVNEALRAWKQRTESTPNGKEAIRKLTRDLDARLTPAREAQNPAVVLLLCDFIDILDPGNGRAQRHREWATLYNNMPRIEIVGWMGSHPDDEDKPSEKDPLEREVEDVTVAFCHVSIPETRKIESIQVREGDEFNGYEFLEIIGRNRGMRLRYLPTGDKIDVYGPRPKPRDRGMLRTE